MADRNHLFLVLALGADMAKMVEKMPALSGKEKKIVQVASIRGTMNRPGRS